MIGRYYILEGHEPVPVDDVIAWARMFAEHDRQVRDTLVRWVRVSTIFLGIDHGFMDDGPPVLFETMVFGGPLDGEQVRYCTWEEAVAGHEDVVEDVRCAMTWKALFRHCVAWLVDQIPMRKRS